MEKKRRGLTNKQIRGIQGLLLIVAALFLIIPYVANQYVLNNNTTIVSKFLSEDELARKEELERQRRENLKIDDSNFYTQEDPFKDGEVQSNSFEDLYDVVGVLTMPQIDEELAIYNITDVTTLSKGLGLLKGTHYPTGGIGNTTVVTGHRGTSSASFFKHIDKLKDGDVIWVDNGVEKLYYEIYDRIIVLPHETSALQMVKEQDTLVLLTCDTPDPTKGLNTHRLIMYARRVPAPAPEVIEEVPVVVKTSNSFIVLGSIGICLLILALRLILKKGRDKGAKKK